MAGDELHEQLVKVDSPQVFQGDAPPDAADHHAADSKPWPAGADRHPAEEATHEKLAYAAEKDAQSAAPAPPAGLPAPPAAPTWQLPPIAKTGVLASRLRTGADLVKLSEKLAPLAADDDFATLTTGLDLGRIKPLLVGLSQLAKIPGEVGSPAHVKAFVEAALPLVRTWHTLRPTGDHEILDRIDRLIHTRDAAFDAVAELVGRSAPRFGHSTSVNLGEFATEAQNAAFTAASINWQTVFSIVETLVSLFQTLFSGSTSPPVSKKAPAMSTTIPPLPPVDPTKHPKLANILKLIQTFGPWILQLLKAFGVNVPITLPTSPTAEMAPIDHDACEDALSSVDMAQLEAACKEACP